MPMLREDLLVPIPGDNPAGQDLRFAPIYDKIKEARREDDDLNQGAWQRERKLADHPLVIKLIQEAIAKQSKDLQLAAWLTESLLKRHGYPGFEEGLKLCHGLVENFWDHLYPELDDGDAEMRAAPLDWIAAKFEFFLRSVPLSDGGYDFYKYKESRTVGYEDQAKTKDLKAARDAALKSGKLPPEIFDKSFGETKKAFYLSGEKSLDGCIATLAALDGLCKEKFGEVATSFQKIRGALEELRHTVHGFLQKKRETEPDPVEEAPSAAVEAVADDGVPAGPGEVAPGSFNGPTSVPTSMPASFVAQAVAEPADRQNAIAQVVAAAAFLRKREPTSPAPYLMLRGLRWGELRAAIEAKDSTQLEA